LWRSWFTINRHNRCEIGYGNQTLRLEEGRLSGSPKEIVFTDKIPKTKSGKVMRRVLKKQYLGEDVGDLSTMEE